LYSTAGANPYAQLEPLFCRRFFAFWVPITLASASVVFVQGI
jgi:hypothetical protein